MSKRLVLWPLLIVLLLLLPALACGSNPLFLSTAPTAGPTPLRPASQESPTSLPVPSPSRTVATPAPSATAPAAQSPATPVRPTATPTEAGASAAAGSADALIISDDEVERMANSISVPGLAFQGLRVQFRRDSMLVSAAGLRYGILSIRDVSVEGRLVVDGGRVIFEADRIEPNNLATAAIPAVVNQFLGRILDSWRVESVRLEPGRMVLAVQPAASGGR